MDSFPGENYSGSKVKPESCWNAFVGICTFLLAMQTGWKSTKQTEIGRCVFFEGYPTGTVTSILSGRKKHGAKKWRFLDRQLADETTKMLYGGEDGMWGMEDA